MCSMTRRRRLTNKSAIAFFLSLSLSLPMLKWEDKKWRRTNLILLNAYLSIYYIGAYLASIVPRCCSSRYANTLRYVHVKQFEIIWVWEPVWTTLNLMKFAKNLRIFASISKWFSYSYGPAKYYAPIWYTVLPLHFQPTFYSYCKQLVGSQWI